MNAFKSILLFFFIIIICLGGCNSREGTQPKVRLELVADGFTSPVALVDPMDGSQHLFVVDQTGLIWIVSEGERLEEAFLDLRGRVD